MHCAVGEMAYQVKPDDLSLIPGSHMIMERENQFPHCPLTSLPCMSHGVFVHAHVGEGGREEERERECFEVSTL